MAYRLLALLFILGLISTKAQESDFAVINAENFENLERVSSLGRGYFQDLRYTSENEIRLISDAGVWHYDLRNPEAYPSWDNATITYPIAVSPNQRWYINYLGELWDSQTYQTIREFPTISSYGYSVFSNDSKYLAVRQTLRNPDDSSCDAASDCMVRVLVWSLEENRQVLLIEVRGIRAVNFAGEYLVLVKEDSSEFYRLPDFEPVFIIPSRLQQFSNDGSTGLYWRNPDESNPQGELVVWDVPSRRIRFTLGFLANENLTSLFLNSDGSKLIVATNRGEEPGFFTIGQNTLVVWDTWNRWRLASFEYEGIIIGELYLSPNERYLATYTQPCCMGRGFPIQVYDLRQNQEVLQVPNDRWRQAVNLVFSPDSETLAVGYFDGRIELAQIESRDIQILDEGYGGYVEEVFFNDESIITTSSDDEVLSWNPENFSLINRQTECRLMAYHSDDLMFCEYRPPHFDEHYIFSSGVLLQTDPENSSAVLRADFSPDGSLLATMMTDGIFLWDSTTGERLRDLDGRAGDFGHGLEFSSDGRYLIAGDIAEIWDMTTGEKISHINLAPVWHSRFTMSETGDWLAFPANNGRVYIWRLSAMLNGMIASEENALSSFVYEEMPESGWGDLHSLPVFINLEAHPDGSLLSFTSVNGLGFYDVQQETLLGYTLAWGNFIRFSPDGKFLVLANGEWCCGGADESLHLGFAQVFGIPE